MTKLNEYAEYWRVYMTPQNEEGIRGITIERYLPHCRKGIIYFKSFAFKGSQRKAQEKAYSLIRVHEAIAPVLVYSRYKLSDILRKKFTNLDIRGLYGSKGFAKMLAQDVIERGVEGEETLINEETIPQLLMELLAAEVSKEATQTQTKTTNGEMTK